MLALVLGATAQAQKRYDPGASDASIKIGQTLPYSGPASAYAVIGRVQAAYFRKVNDEGGVNGRRIDFVSLDDGYAPPKTFEVSRRLVEQEKVLLLFQTVGTPTNMAIHEYVNARKVPHLFVATGASKWNDPVGHPWTMGWQPNYQTETQVYARDILKERPNARIAVLYQNDDYGKDALKGLRDGLGAKAAGMIAAEASYEVTDATIDSQILQLKASDADVLVNIATSKFAAQAIRKVHDIGWQPRHYLNNISQSVGAVLTPAGLNKSVGLITSIYNKDPTDPKWADDPAMQEWRAFMRRYYPEGNVEDALNVYGYGAARALVQVLKQCGDDLTRQNVMRQAANLRNFETGVELPGVRLNTSPTRHAPMQAMQLARFDGKSWVEIGHVINVAD
ncbi:ABC transporter substrate-binding protein [Variovorax sp. LjRoot290]|uniref:ABC transporter substrate-binding protein n=1 Tax=Variovorax sp. LjRoot290 TaxID=3342316 RepID=UPI003ECF14B7